MRTITIEIPEGKEAKWVNGVLTLVDEQPVEFKFKEGDKVAITHGEYKCYTIYLCGADNGKAYYWLIDENEVPHPKYPEDMLELYVEQPKDITERIKTFEDACEWCDNNDNENLTLAYKEISDSFKDMANMQDVFAYLKLRIITCALNEGWEPTTEDKRYGCCFNTNACVSTERSFTDCAYKLGFKTGNLAEYAATQFKDIYMDFCHKGKE